jgi:hypothetical protein
MKGLITILFLCFCVNLFGQNVGIGNLNPINGKLVVRGTVGAVSAMFGDNTTGVAIENSFPGIAFNSYFNGTRKYIASGFGGLFGLNPTNGDMYIMNTAVTGVADANATLLTRLFVSGANGNIGINTSNPTSGKLTLDATGTGTGMYVSATSGATNGIRIENFGAAPAYGLNVYSQNSDAIYASASASGTALHTNGKSQLDAPVGINTAPNNLYNLFVDGTSANSGIFCNGAGATYGIRAESFNGFAAIRAYGFGTNSYAINAENTGAGAYAMYALGNVHVQGTLSKAAGSFKIDHPQDPANKFLIHSFVESPDMMNIYNGIISTNAAGMAIVQLPAYFEAENIDFKYQLTIMGKVFAQAIVYDEIKNNHFSIKTDKPNIKLSWQVTGVRNDVYAQKNRIVPEVEKSEKEKGKYLAPELFNEAKEKGIGYADKKN